MAFRITPPGDLQRLAETERFMLQNPGTFSRLALIVNEAYYAEAVIIGLNVSSNAHDNQ